MVSILYDKHVTNESKIPAFLDYVGYECVRQVVPLCRRSRSVSLCTICAYLSSADENYEERHFCHLTSKSSEIPVVKCSRCRAHLFDRRPASSCLECQENAINCLKDIQWDFTAPGNIKIERYLSKEIIPFKYLPRSRRERLWRSMRMEE